MHGLLLDLPRKSIEPMVLTLYGADGNAVRGMQQFLGEGKWDDLVIRLASLAGSEYNVRRRRWSIDHLMHWGKWYLADVLPLAAGVVYSSSRGSPCL